MRLFGGIILFGLVLPWLVMVSVVIFFKPTEALNILKAFPGKLFAPGHNLFLVGLVNAIPFFAFALVMFFQLSRPSARDRLSFAPGIAALIGAGSVVLGVSLWIQLAVWINLYGPGHPSSTAVIAFVFVPIYGLFLMPIGYGVGWLIGKAILWTKIREN